MPKPTRIPLLAVLAMLALADAGVSQQPRTIVHAGRLVDVDAGVLRQDMLIEVEGERIVSVRPAGGTVPAGAIDLRHATVLPGLIDAHVHLMLAGRPDSNAAATLRAGFTTVQDLGSIDGSNIRLRDDIAAGRTLGPRVIASGPWLGVSGGICDFSGIGVRGAEAFRQRVTADVGLGADLIKVCVTGWLRDAIADPAAVEPNDDELRAAITAAHAAGKRVAVHAIGSGGVRHAIEMGADMVVHGGLPDSATIALLRGRGTPVVSTLTTLGGGGESPAGAALRERMAAAKAAGVTIVFGTDAGVMPHGRNAREFRNLARIGFTPLEALRAATSGAAQALGLSGRAGTLAPGAWADIIAVTGNPLEDTAALESVVFVMKGGAVLLR